MNYLKGSMWRWGLVFGLTLAGCLSLAALALAQAGNSSGAFSQLRYRFLGPVGNRADAIVGVPGNPQVVYVGAATGGIWKTSDGGINWKPIFDNQDVAAIGALALAPSAPNIVWAGTGEPFLIRPDDSMGDGVYKSTDGGKTWQHMGLEQTGHIARVIVDPHDPSIVFVCAEGQLYRPNAERGVYRSTDGGRNWQQVLSVNNETGCSDLSMDAHNSQTLFAGMWQVVIHTWNLDSGGTSGGVYVSHDGGTTWKKLVGHGLPPGNQPVGKTAVQVAPTDSNRVYALIEEHTPSLYRSEDGGRTWTLVNQQHAMSERSPYYNRFAVSTGDEDVLYFMSVIDTSSRDGGNTIQEIPSRVSLHDSHDVWVDPLNPNRIMIANDEGADISLNHATTFQPVVLPISQIYHVYTDNRIPYYVYGNRQDGPSFRGPSNNLVPSRGGGFSGGSITEGDWTHVGGCESGFAIPDPVDNNIIWSGCYNGDMTRMDLRTGQVRSVTVWPDATYGWAPKDVKYRWHWTFPIAISPFDHNQVFVGSQYVHETSDGGTTWHVISPDLTRNDKSHEGNSGGIGSDQLMTFDGATLYSIALSPLQKGVIWTGSNDGEVNITRDGGKTWVNVTKNIPNLPPWGTIWQITPSYFDAGTAYIVDNLEQMGDYNAYVYKTTDFGQSWQLISAGVPKSPNSSAHSIIEDPVRKGMLYLGTDNAIYVSWDEGGHWTLLRNNLPPAPVFWLSIQKHYGDLDVATYGRGIWILDDITPLREWDKAQQSTVYFFKPRPGYRYRQDANSRQNAIASHVVGSNPPPGADLNYYLQKPAKNVTITISDPNGQVIRTLKGPTRAGIDRVWWDLRYDAPVVVKLRTSPPDEPWVKNGPIGYRLLHLWTHYRPPTVVPDTYTVKLDVDGNVSQQSLQVLRDPNSLGTQQDINTLVKFQLQIRSEENDDGDLINHVEWTRRQIEDLESLLGADPKTADLVSAAKSLDAQEVAAERKMVDVEMTGRNEDQFRNPMGLYGRISDLGERVEMSADLPPTTADIEVNQLLQRELGEARQALNQLETKYVPEFNALLKSRGLSMAIQP